MFLDDRSLKHLECTIPQVGSTSDGPVPLTLGGPHEPNHRNAPNQNTTPVLGSSMPSCTMMIFAVTAKSCAVVIAISRCILCSAYAITRLEGLRTNILTLRPSNPRFNQHQHTRHHFPTYELPNASMSKKNVCSSFLFLRYLTPHRQKPKLPSVPPTRLWNSLTSLLYPALHLRPPSGSFPAAYTAPSTSPRNSIPWSICSSFTILPSRYRRPKRVCEPSFTPRTPTLASTLARKKLRLKRCSASTNRLIWRVW